MAKKSAERPMIDMIEVPPGIAEQTAKQQAAAPYCGLGFKKSRLDEALHARMLEMLAASAPLFRAERKIDVVGSGNSNVIPSLYFEDKAFNASVSRALQPAHEEWSGMRLTESACYGFRVYQRGTYLHNHVDRTETHIISSTICVDYRLDSPWPLYIEDVEGRGHQIDLEPGEFVYYEGARLLHGRPYPLDGDYYVGMFVHYRPVDYPSANGRIL